MIETGNLTEDLYGQFALHLYEKKVTPNLLSSPGTAYTELAEDTRKGS